MTRLADAYDLLAEAAATVALELRAYADGGGMPPVRAQDALGVAVDARPEEPPNWTETDDWPEATPKPVGSAAVCPAHGTEYREGKYGTPYCPNQGTDPKWTNDRGYCTINPKNAAAYLRQKAAR